MLTFRRSSPRPSPMRSRRAGGGSRSWLLPEDIPRDELEARTLHPSALAAAPDESRPVSVVLLVIGRGPDGLAAGLGPELGPTWLVTTEASVFAASSGAALIVVRGNEPGLVREVRQQWPHVPIAVVTPRSVPPVDIVALYDLGVDHVVTTGLPAVAASHLRALARRLGPKRVFATDEIEIDGSGKGSPQD